MSLRKLLFLTLVLSLSVSGQETVHATRGSFLLKQTPSNIQIFDGKDALRPIISFSESARKSWRQIAADAQGQRLDFQLSYQVLSFVGPYLSVQKSEYCDCGGAHPSDYVDFETVDVSKSTARTQPPTMLNDLFPEAAILSALENDKNVSTTLETLKVPRPSNLKDLMGALKFQILRVGECDYTFGENLLSHYAFYNVTSGRVAVRIGLSHGSEICRGQITQLGILLPLPESLSSDFMAAKEKKSGLLMIDANTRKQVDFSFTTERK